MESPGVSLFDGGGSINIDNTAQRLQEEEAAEDQKRRDLELQYELQNAFDDLEDDDDDEDDDYDDDYDDNDSSKFNSLNVSRSRFEKSRRANVYDLKALANKTPLGNLRDELSDGAMGKSDQDDKENLHLQNCNSHMRNMHSEPKRNRNYIPHNEDVSVRPEARHFKEQLNSPGREYQEYILSKPISEYIPGDQQLQMLYEVRVREVQRLSEELNNCRRDAAAAHDALYGRLAVANADRERTQLSLQQSQELVANSKHQIMELEHKVTSLTNKVDSLQSRNDELAAEVTAATASLIDTQNRMQAQKFNNINAQSTDALFRAQQERYKEDTERLEQDLFRTRNKLSEKENELLVFEKRFIDMERLKEDLLVEKGSKINKLAFELEEAQNRLANNDNMGLKDKISHLTKERNAARIQVKEMANKLESTANELVETRAKLLKIQEEMAILENTVGQLIDERESDSFTQLKSSKTGRTPSSQSDKIELLRLELSKSISIQKIRKEQISKLNKTILKKDEQIENYKADELKIQEELEYYKEKEIKLTTELNSLMHQVQLLKSNVDSDLYESMKFRCNELEQQLNDKTLELNSVRIKRFQHEESALDSTMKKSSGDVAHSNLIKEYEVLSLQLQDAKKQTKNFETLYIEVCAVRDSLTKEIEDLKSNDLYESLEAERANVEELLNQLKIEKLKVDDLGNQLLNTKLEEFQKDLNDLKKDNNDVVQDKIELIKITEKLKDENKKLKESNDERSKQLTLLINELEESKHLINQLNSEIELQGQREALIKDLKEKAKQFEHFISNKNEKASNMKSVCTSPIVSKEKDETVSVNRKEFEMEKLSMEKKIREEVAHHFSIELKRIENEFNNKKNVEMEQMFSKNFNELGAVLELKTREIETLKNHILSERTRFEEALTKSHGSNKDETLHDDCRKQITAYQNNIKELFAEINRLKHQIDSNVELNELQQKYLESLKSMEKFKEKYKTVKKTASKYKEYIAEKDKHVNSEINRIKSAYQNSLSKLNERLNIYIMQKEQMNAKVNTKTTKFDENLPELNSEIDSLKKS